MTLPGATLFPQALLPLYIFEPRYRKMLSDMLGSDRMIIVAMQKPGRKRETPCDIAGLGLIRVSVGHQDGTSHLILQGLTRVELQDTVQYKPYRIQHIRPLETPAKDNVVIDALLAKVFELVKIRLAQGDLPFPVPVYKNHPQADSDAGNGGGADKMSAQEIMNHMEIMEDPEQVADLVACAVLQGPVARQIILETMDLELRLKHLIHFLMAEIHGHQKNTGP